MQDVMKTLNEVLENNKKLRAENEALRAEVREWLCDGCNSIIPAPKLTNLLCPKCSEGLIRPTTYNQRKLEAKLKEVTAERDALQAKIDGGLRVHAIYQQSYDNYRCEPRSIDKNATLIFDEYHDVSAQI